jgi:carbon monoxide dehydrogenase subunit G
MEFGGRYRFSAGRLAVWHALNDAAILKAVIPGCERIEWTGPASLDLVVRVSLGIVRPHFSGQLELSDVHPAERYTLTGRGKGGLLGLAQASAQIALADDGPDTILSFDAIGKADSGIMRLGRALIGNSAQKIIDGFFEAIGGQMRTKVVPIAAPRDDRPSPPDDRGQ